MPIVRTASVALVASALLSVPHAVRAQVASDHRASTQIRGIEREAAGLSPTVQSVATISTPHDSLWNGVLIGAGAGAIAGMIVAPTAMCGTDDPECTTIVRVAVGLPSIAAGAGLGALIDALVYSKRPEVPRRIDVTPLIGRRATGVRVRLNVGR
jgi:ABC-type Fe3+-siderophore transport system permease subunit